MNERDEECLYKKINNKTNMETKKAKVTKVVQNTRSFESQYGKQFVHFIEFDNGDKGDYNSKSDKCEKFKEGEFIDYEIKLNDNPQYPSRIKPISQQQNGFKHEPKDQGAITALSCISSACNLYAGSSQNTSENVLATAEKFFLFVTSKSSKQ